MRGIGGFTLLVVLGALCVGCHKTPDNDGLQAHQLRALDILESLEQSQADKSDQ